MKNLLLNTDKQDYGTLIARVLLGVVLFPHGAQKLLGWFGGYGFEGTMGYFTGTVGLPWVVGFMVILVEFFGALLLIAGLGSRFLGTSVALLAIGIILTAHNKYFFMNWFGNQPEEGYEYFLLMIGLSVVVALKGGGAWSADSLLSRTEVKSARLEKVF